MVYWALMKVKYSWIIPVKNEEASLPQLISEIARVMHTVIPYQNRYGIHKYEILAVDDASTDNSLTTLKSFTPNRPGSGLTTRTPLKVIYLASHQGKWAALRVGFEAAEGEIIITSDSDLQDDPGGVIKLLNKLEPILSLRGPMKSDRGNLSYQGYDLVSGARLNRFDPLYKVFISRLGNFLVSKITGHHFKDLNSSFKVYKREVLDHIPKDGSLLRFSMLFAMRLGYRVCEVPITHRPRLFGKSKFGVIKYLRIIYDLILVMLLFTGSGRVRLGSGRIRKKQ